MGTRIQRVYGVGGPLIPVMPTPIIAQRAPVNAVDTEYPQGQQWFDNSQSPPVQYVFVDGINGTWETGGNAPATTTSFGTVILTDNNEPVATKFYADNLAILGSPVSTTTVPGIGELATDAEAVAGTASTPALALFVTPSNLAAVFAAPPAQGGTTPAAGNFTTLGATGLITGGASASITTGATTLNLGADAANGAVNIGTAGTRAIIVGNSTATTSVDIRGGTGSSVNIGANAVAHTVTIGNNTTTTAVAITSGTGGIALASTTTGDITLNSSDTLLLDSAGVLELNSSAGVISIGNDAVSQNINVGTAGTRDITIGNITAATGIVLNSGTNGIQLISTGAGDIKIASSDTVLIDGAGVVEINSSAGVIGIGNDAVAQNINIGTGAAARIITIGNVSSTTGIVLNSGTGGVAINTTTTGDVVVTSADTVLIDSAGVLELNSSAGIISIGNDAVSQNINVGTAGTRAIAIGNSTSTTSVAINGGTGSSVNIGTNAIAHTVTIGNITTTTAVTVNTGTGGFNVNTTSTGDIVLASADTVLIDSAGVLELNSSAGVISIGNDAVAQNINLGTAGARTITIGNVTALTAVDINVGTGNFALEGSVGATYKISSTGVNVGLIQIGTGTGAQQTDIANNTGVKTINIAGDTATGNNIIKIGSAGGTSSTLTMGSTTGGSTTTINSGTGNVNVTGGHLSIASVAKTLLVNGGAVTDFIGTGVLTAGTQTIANTNIATGDVILLTRLTVAASTTLGEFTYTIINATSFTVTSVILGTPGSTQTGDVSTYAYFIVRPT